MKARHHLIVAYIFLGVTLFVAACTYFFVQSIKYPKAAALTGVTWIRGEAPAARQASLLVFGATWCPDCIRFAPELEALFQKWQPQGVAVVSLALETPDKLIEGLGRIGTPDSQVPLGAATRRINAAYNGRFAQTNIPVAYLIGRQGRILWYGDPADADAVMTKLSDDICL